VRRPALTGRHSALLTAIVVAVLGCAGDGQPGRGGSHPPAVITISTAPGERLAFDPTQSAVAGPGRLEITFRNVSSVAHNLVFTGGVEAGTRTIVEPATEDDVVVDFPAPGTYPFVCTIHDGMAGAVLVE
jgi:plastocyanin